MLVKLAAPLGISSGWGRIIPPLNSRAQYISYRFTSPLTAAQAASPCIHHSWPNQ